MKSLPTSWKGHMHFVLRWQMKQKTDKVEESRHTLSAPCSLPLLPLLAWTIRSRENKRRATRVMTNSALTSSSRQELCRRILQRSVYYRNTFHGWDDGDTKAEPQCVDKVGLLLVTHLLELSGNRFCIRNFFLRNFFLILLHHLLHSPVQTWNCHFNFIWFIFPCNHKKKQLAKEMRANGHVIKKHIFGRIDFK